MCPSAPLQSPWTWSSLSDTQGPVGMPQFYDFRLWTNRNLPVLCRKARNSDSLAHICDAWADTRQSLKKTQPSIDHLCAIKSPKAKGRWNLASKLWFFVFERLWVRFKALQTSLKTLLSPYCGSPAPGRNAKLSHDFSQVWVSIMAPCTLEQCAMLFTWIAGRS